MSDVAAPVTLSGTLAKVDLGGNGVSGHILVNGVEVWSRAISGTDSTGVSYAVDVTLRPGDVIDFALDPSQSQDLSDQSRFTAVIRSLGPINHAPALAALPNRSVAQGVPVSFTAYISAIEMANVATALRTVCRCCRGAGSGERDVRSSVPPIARGRCSTCAIPLLPWVSISRLGFRR